jgi:PGF-CTERM motif protein
MGDVPRHGWSLAAGGLVALVLLLPVAPAVPAPGEPSPPAVVTFYAHWQDLLDRAPLNTLPPDPVRERDLNAGFQMPTLVARPPCGDPCNVTFQNNVFTLFTFPRADTLESGSQYDMADPSYDVNLGDGPILVYVYLSAHPVPSQNSTGEVGELTNAGLMPLVQVEALWETGHHTGQGIPIASGAAPQTINMVYVPGGDPVYEIAIPMGRYVDTIPSGLGTILTVRVHQVAAGNLELQQSNWRLRSGPQYPWRLVVPVENPLIKRDLQSWILNDEVHVRWGVKAAFGAYDIDASTFRLRLRGGGENAVELPPAEVEYSPLHDPEVKTVYAHWVVPFKLLEGPDRWDIHTSVANVQGTTGLEAEGDVHLTHFEGKNETPGFGLVLALVALAGALGRRRLPP